MRPLKSKLPLSPESLRDFLLDRRPMCLGELRMYFGGNEEEVQYALFLAVQLGYLTYHPASRDVEARWAYGKDADTRFPTPRISPLEPKGELKYDLYSHARLCERR
jgi:hypothetical protein